MQATVKKNYFYIFVYGYRVSCLKNILLRYKYCMLDFYGNSFPNLSYFKLIIIFRFRLLRAITFLLCRYEILKKL